MRLRVLIAVTHLLGVGHLTRAAALARAFAGAGHDTALASGGMPARLVRTDNVDFVQLPPVRVVGTDFRVLRDEDGRPAPPSRFAARRDLLLDLVAERRPDVVVTELFPFGRRSLAGEFMALVEAAKAARPKALAVASVRDILVTPAQPARIATAHAVLRAHYDAILVHGDPDLVPLDASWPLDEGARALVRYTGYVDEGTAPAAPVSGRGREIVVSGGGSGAGVPLYRTALAAAARMPDRPWRILVGGGVSEADFIALRGAAPLNAVLERARPDFRNLLAAAAASVSQAGYNTALDILRTGVPAVLVPFEQDGETEQRLRAERIAGLGLAEVVPEAALSPGALAAAVGAVLARPPAPPPALALDGAAQSVAAVEALAAARRGPAASGLRLSRSLWRPLEEALRRAGDAGRPIPVWWRDDDAVSATPPLGRLLALARGLGLPLALAAIPRSTDSSLAAAIAGEARAHLLVHGLAHENHAPPSEKKAELGAHRPLARLVEDAERALALARERFGGRLLPVLVPPWNRIDLDLAERLPGLGYRGLSTFGAGRTPVPGLVRIDTHLDPIAWHEGRGLRDPAALAAELAALIDARTRQTGDPEPIGLLTHHLVHDEATWGFCEALLGTLAEHSIVRFPDVPAMYVGAATPAA